MTEESGRKLVLDYELGDKREPDLTNVLQDEQRA